MLAFKMDKSTFGNLPLTEDEIRLRAPSVFAESAHESRSEKFRAIPSISALRALKREGFSVFSARQSWSRDTSKRPFAKHMIRLRREDGRQRRVGDSIFEVVLRNGNDGSSSWDLVPGLFRIRCLNGLVSQIGDFGTYRVRHSGDVTTKVVDGTYAILERSEAVLSAVESWGRIYPKVDLQMELARRALAIRYPDPDSLSANGIKPEALLSLRRFEDGDSDLWTIWNRVQENVIKGGLFGRATLPDGRARRFTTRPVRGIDADHRINNELWSLGQEIANAAS
jgi:hypothetical protein